MREPAFAAWIIMLCPDREVIAKHLATILETVTQYRYDRLPSLDLFRPRIRLVASATRELKPTTTTN